MSDRRWEPGDTIVERTIWLGAVLTARPMTVVSDSADVLAVSLRIGTPWYGILFDDRTTILEEFQRGDLRWGHKTWTQHSVLYLVRPGDAYSVQAFRNEEGAFVGWYVNLQDPVRRTSLGIDTRDHVLDIIVGEDLASFMWKDEDELESSVGLGLHTRDEADAIRRAGEEVIELVESGRTWWGGWKDWAPDPSWPIPTLPDGWDEL